MVHPHHMSGLSGGKLVWSILFAKEIDLIGKVALYEYYIVTVSLWHCTTAQAIFNIPILSHMVKIVLLYHSKIYLRYSSGQRLRDGARLWQVAKYGKPTEILNTNRNGIFFQKWHGHNQQPNHGHTKAYQAVPARKNYPFKNSMFCCKPELQTSNFPVMKLDEVVSNSQHLSQSKD